MEFDDLLLGRLLEGRKVASRDTRRACFDHSNRFVAVKTLDWDS